MATLLEGNFSFENAAVMLEACQEAFEREGFKSQALSLRGVEATSPSAAMLAYTILTTLPKGNAETDAAVRYALAALAPVHSLRLAS
jgi:hypothetical protein